MAPDRLSIAHKWRWSTQKSEHFQFRRHNDVTAMQGQTAPASSIKPHKTVGWFGGTIVVLGADQIFTQTSHMYANYVNQTTAHGSVDSPHNRQVIPKPEECPCHGVITIDRVSLKRNVHVCIFGAISRGVHLCRQAEAYM